MRGGLSHSGENGNGLEFKRSRGLNPIKSKITYSSLLNCKVDLSANIQRFNQITGQSDFMRMLVRQSNG